MDPRIYTAVTTTLAPVGGLIDRWQDSPPPSVRSIPLLIREMIRRARPHWELQFFGIPGALPGEVTSVPPPILARMKRESNQSIRMTGDPEGDHWGWIRLPIFGLREGVPGYLVVYAPEPLPSPRIFPHLGLVTAWGVHLLEPNAPLIRLTAETFDGVHRSLEALQSELAAWRPPTGSFSASLESLRIRDTALLVFPKLTRILHDLGPVHTDRNHRQHG